MSESRIVFSSDHGSYCPECGKALTQCEGHKKKALSSASAGRKPLSGTKGGKVQVGRETQGRRGKGVTVIANLPVSSADLEVWGKKLKQICGSGGTVKDGRIEIQGDHRDRLVQALTEAGFSVVRSGG